MGDAETGKEKLTVPKTLRALRADESIKIDGILSEKVWQGKGYGGFTQTEPDDGQPATEPTEVWIAYDQKALYVAARMYDSQPDKIIGRLARRDDFVDSDWFVFSVDPYFDRLSGYQFAVNPAGTYVDWTISNDEQRDTTWDGIWESSARIDGKGWTVEIRIPYNQLRFKKSDKYKWGVHFRRLLKRREEWSGIVWIPRKASGFVSRFSTLEGIEGIKPRRYIELLPYAAGKAAYSTEEEGNPFETGEDYSVNGGLDMKLGLRSNLTLDLTVNPDFGQVEVDPAQINLGAGEIYYSEKRPFFMEGVDIFDFGNGGANNFTSANYGNPRFFYSRRIGRPPQGYVDSDGYVNYPDWTTILAAVKLTGKPGKGWSVGFLSALTEKEYAKIDLEGERSQENVEPFTYYGVLRARKEFNKGRQGLGIMATAVLRNLQTENLKNSLARDALAFAVDGWTFLDKKKIWVFTGWLGTTRVSGTKEMIWDLQHAYPHYFQRPDADHVELDPEATSMSGVSGRFTLNKQSGNLMVNAALGFVSPGFDSRDMGFMWRNDIINAHIKIGYRDFKPGKIFRWWSVNAYTQRNYNFDGKKIGEQRLILIADASLLNYWGLYTQWSINTKQWSDTATRGGPMMLVRPYTWAQFGIYTDTRKPLVVELAGGFFSSSSGTFSWEIYPTLRWQPSTNFSISISPLYDYDKDLEQWVTNIEDAYMTDTFGSRYIFGELKQKTFSCSIRLSWFFTPRLSLQAYIQPYMSAGDYTRLKELSKPRTNDFNVYGEGGSTITYNDDQYTVDPDGTGTAPEFSFSDPDFNYKSLRGTVVLRWEYLPGSTLYAVWTQNRADYANPGDFRFGRDFGDLLRAPGDNIFMIKFTYRFQM